MLIKRILAFSIFCSFIGLVGCGSDNTSYDNTTEMTTQSPVSNSINGAFDGYQYNMDEYMETTEDINTRNGYQITNPNNSRFGEGMKGAENIYGNDENIIKDKMEDIKNNTKENYEDIKDKTKEGYEDIKDKAKESYEDVKDNSKEAYQKIKDSIKS